MLRHGVKDLLILTSLATALFVLVGWAAGAPPQAPRPPQAPPIPMATVVVKPDDSDKNAEPEKAAYVWKKIPGAPNQRALYLGKKYVGNWEAEDKVYRPRLGKNKWGKACEPPVDPPKVKVRRAVRYYQPPPMFFGGGGRGGGC